MVASLLKSGFYYLIESKDEFLKLGIFEWKIEFEKPNLKHVKIHKDKRRTVRERKDGHVNHAKVGPREV